MEKICEYGCGQIAHFQLGNGKWCCSSHYSSCPSVRKKNSESLSKAHKEGRMPKFSKESRDKSHKALSENNHKKFLDNPFKDYLSETIRWNLAFSGRPYKCEACGLDSNWNGLPLKLQVHHKNGNRLDNRLANLAYLCPNCHSQTETFCNQKAKIKVPDEELLEALHTTSSIKEALIKVGLNFDSKDHYKRCRKLLQDE